MKKYLLITVLCVSGFSSFSQIYGVGNGSGQAINCIVWNFGAVLLPVDQSSFDVTCTGTKAILRWWAPNTTNNAQFNVERSTDGINFSYLAHTYSKTTSGNMDYFTYIDASLPQGRVYYRLLEIRDDGQHIYSTVASAACNVSNTGSELVYPNPTSGIVNIKTTSGNAVLILRNSIGQLLYRQEVKEPGEVTIDLGQYAQGIYYIEINSPGKTSHHKIILNKQ